MTNLFVRRVFAEVVAGVKVGEESVGGFPAEEPPCCEVKRRLVEGVRDTERLIAGFTTSLTRQGRDVLPGSAYRGVGDQRLAQIRGHLVHHLAGYSLAAHRVGVTRVSEGQRATPPMSRYRINIRAGPARPMESARTGRTRGKSARAVRPDHGSATTTGGLQGVGDHPCTDEPQALKRRSRWLGRVIISLLTVPGGSDAEKRAILEEFVVPVVVPTHLDVTG